MPKRPSGAVPLQLRFGDAVKVAQQIQNKGGGSLTLPMLAEAMGYSLSSSGFRMKLSAMKQHGLIEDEGKEKIKLSDLGLSVVAPPPEDEGRSLKDAFLRVSIYKSIHERYANKLLPLKGELANLLIHERKLDQKTAQVWAENFIDGAEGASLTRPRGERLLLLENPHMKGKEDRPTEPPPVDNPHRDEPPAPPVNPNARMFSIPFPSGTVQITIPHDLKPKEFEALIGMLEAYQGKENPLTPKEKKGE